jgi:hypothetical protein
MQGNLVRAKIAASNSIGEGPFSLDNSNGALIIVLPHTPPTGPQRDVATSTQTSIGVFMPTIEGIKTGGSAILSYSLEFMQNGVWTTLVGFTPFTLNNYFTHTGLVMSTSYTYRYRVTNAIGWSGYSPSTTLICGGVPDQMNPVTTSMNSNFL